MKPIDLALAAPALDDLLERLELGDLLAERHGRVLLTAAERVEQLGLGDRDGAGLADDDPGREVRERGGVVAVEADGDRRGERRDRGVAGAGDVEDLTGPGGHVVHALGVDDRDAGLAAGERDELELQRLAQLGGGGRRARRGRARTRR